MAHPAYDLRPPILGDEYDGEHDAEINELRMRLLAYLDLARYAVLRPEDDDKFARTKTKDAEAILVVGCLNGGGDELLVRAETFNRGSRAASTDS